MRLNELLGRCVDAVGAVWFWLRKSLANLGHLVLTPFYGAFDLIAVAWHALTGVVRELSFLIPVDLFEYWYRTRDVRDLLCGLPALIGLLALAVCGTVALLPAETPAIEHYLIKAANASQNDQDDLAKLYLQKAGTVIGGARDARFNQALLLESVGHENQAYAIMRQLAPDDEPGFVPAHQWRIDWLQKRLAENMESDVSSPEDRAKNAQIASAIESQLRLIVEAEPEHLNANDRLAVILMARKDIPGALSFMARVVDRRPETRAVYAQLLATQGRMKEARTQAERAVDHHQKMLKDDALPNEQMWANRMRMSAGFSILGRHKEAAQCLIEGGDPSENPSVKKLLSDTLFRWSRSINPTDGRLLLQQLNLLGEALKLNPGDPRILEQVATIAGSPGEPGAIASGTLKELLSSGQAPPVVHFVLGMNATRRGDMQAAVMHYELAYHASPETPVTLNNLAYVISQGEGADLNRSLELVNQAIKLDDSVPDFFDTRGEIYMKMGRWRSAIADLEYALKRIPDRSVLHRKLSASYAATGDAEMAALHRLRAEQKDKRLAEAKAEKERKARANPKPAPVGNAQSQTVNEVVPSSVERPSDP